MKVALRVDSLFLALIGLESALSAAKYKRVDRKMSEFIFDLGVTLF